MVFQNESESGAAQNLLEFDQKWALYVKIYVPVMKLPKNWLVPILLKN